VPTEFQTFLQQALLRNAKSTALKPLAGLVAALLGGCILASRYSLDEWLVMMLGLLTFLTVLIFLGIYLFFAFTNPDQLRSEKYIIQKTAIQHGFIGDDKTGYIKFTKVDDLPLLNEGKKSELGKGGE
jgi:hypothetical protein